MNVTDFIKEPHICGMLKVFFEQMWKMDIRKYLEISNPKFFYSKISNDKYLQMECKDFFENRGRFGEITDFLIRYFLKNPLKNSFDVWYDAFHFVLDQLCDKSNAAGKRTLNPLFNYWSEDGRLLLKKHLIPSITLARERYGMPQPNWRTIDMTLERWMKEKFMKKDHDILFEHIHKNLKILKNMGKECMDWNKFQEKLGSTAFKPVLGMEFDLICGGYVVELKETKEAWNMRYFFQVVVYYTLLYDKCKKILGLDLKGVAIVNTVHHQCLKIDLNWEECKEITVMLWYEEN